MKTIQKLTICLLVTLVFGACTNRKQSVLSAPVHGEYRLVEVDGKPVPARVTHGTAAIRVVSGQMSFDAEGNCRSLTVFGPPEGDDIVREVYATYTLKGRDVDLVWKGAGRTRGTFGHETFTMNNEGMIFSYQKKGNGE